MSDEKTTAVWLVDVGYVVKASEGKFKLDYVRAERMLAEKFGATTTYLFNGYDTAYGIPSGLQAFYDVMTRHGMKVSLQPMQSGPPGINQQRRVDVDFSAHLVWQAGLPHINTLVVTTGDQDFVPAITLVREQFDKRVVLFTYDAMVHSDLVGIASEWWHFEKHAEHISRR